MLLLLSTLRPADGAMIDLDRAMVVATQATDQYRYIEDAYGSELIVKLLMYLVILHILAVFGARCILQRLAARAMGWFERVAPPPRSTGTQTELADPIQSGHREEGEAEIAVLFSRFTVSQLRDDLRRRGLPVGGLKDDLVTRLRNAPGFATDRQLRYVGSLLKRYPAQLIGLGNIESVANASDWIDGVKPGR